MAKKLGVQHRMSQSIIIDRRLNSKGKSTVNRERFMRRYRKHIRRAVNDAVNRRSITDTESGEKISISKKNLSEPIFHHDSDGKTEQVLPGNREFLEGDRIRRPKSQGGNGAGKGNPSDKGEGVDDFVFNINREEFLEYLFDDLELPNMLRKEVQDYSEFSVRRAGYISAGAPERLHVVRSLKNAYARRIALSGKDRREIRRLKSELKDIENNGEVKDLEYIEKIRERIVVLNKKIRKMPFIDDFDLKYSNVIKVPAPSSKAVMFCIMDVSGSMTRDIKDMAKRFFFLLYLFLQKNYESVEIVFIRHHAEARECNEEDFFYARETGGTVVSSALKLADDIIKKRYQSSSWNVYVAQASDGDNWEADSPRCSKIIRENILPHVQYYAYVEITDRQHQNLWHEYQKLKDEYPEYFSMAHIRKFGEVYPVFRELFEKREAVTI